MSGTPASTSSRKDRGAGARTLRYYQFLAMQAGLVVVLVLVAWFSRRDVRTVALCLETLVVPVGWSLTFGLAHARVEARRKAGTWTAAWEQQASKKALAILGGIMMVWVLVATLTVLYA